MELRIRLQVRFDVFYANIQRVMTAANRLPRPSTLPLFQPFAETQLQSVRYPFIDCFIHILRASVNSLLVQQSELEADMLSRSSALGEVGSLKRPHEDDTCEELESILADRHERYSSFLPHLC